MAFNEALLREFDHEMAGTRTSLERVPEDKFGWKPHPKSPTMGWLAGHLAELPGWAVATMEQDSLDLAPGGAPPAPRPVPASRREVLDNFDKNVAAARTAIGAAAPEHLDQPWTLLRGGKALFTMSRSAVLRGFVISHMIHHRAQLGVYLRLNDVPVPALYGPSADEPGMMSGT